MLGAYDFCGHYAWTFAWLRRRSGQGGLEDYWRRAIAEDSQAHAREAFQRGFEGMQDYWGHTLAEEGAGYTSEVHERADGGVMRIDMYACPSRGFLLRNGLDYGTDYCDHCVGWIGPALEEAGFVIDHEHDHQAHCWWELRSKADPTPPSGAGELSDSDVRLLPTWSADTVDSFRRATGPDGKEPPHARNGVSP